MIYLYASKDFHRILNLYLEELLRIFLSLSALPLATFLADVSGCRFFFIRQSVSSYRPTIILFFKFKHYIYDTEIHASGIQIQIPKYFIYLILLIRLWTEEIQWHSYAYSKDIDLSSRNRQEVSTPHTHSEQSFRCLTENDNDNVY